MGEGGGCRDTPAAAIVTGTYARRLAKNGAMTVSASASISAGVIKEAMLTAGGAAWW